MWCSILFNIKKYNFVLFSIVNLKKNIILFYLVLFSIVKFSKFQNFFFSFHIADYSSSSSRFGQEEYFWRALLSLKAMRSSFVVVGWTYFFKKQKKSWKERMKTNEKTKKRKENEKKMKKSTVSGCSTTVGRSKDLVFLPFGRFWALGFSGSKSKFVEIKDEEASVGETFNELKSTDPNDSSELLIEFTFFNFLR